MTETDAPTAVDTKADQSNKDETVPAAATAAAPVADAVQNGDEQPHTNGETTETNGEEKPTEPPKEMRAIVLSGFGGLKGVKILKKPEPTVGAGEILIRVKACGLNFQDLMVRLGAIDSPPKTPCIMGFECAGEIEAIGDEVENFKIGDRVVALPEFKAWSEMVVVSEKFVYKIPDNMSYAEAAAIAMSYLVAHILVFDLAGIRSGKSLLLHSAGGSVGQAIIQLCKTIDNVTVFGIASKNKHEVLTSTGLINHLLERGSDYLNEVRKISSEGVDVVFDCLCGEECSKGYNLLKPMGKYILYGSATVVTGETKSFFSVARSWWQVDKISPIKLYDENKSLMGFNLRHLLYQQDGHQYVRDQMTEIFKLWSAGKIKPIIDSTWAFEDVAEAMQKLHDRKNIGKLIMDPAQTPKPKPATPAKGKAKDKKQVSEEKKTDGGGEGDGARGDADKKDGSPTESVKNGENVSNGEGGGDSKKTDDNTNGEVNDKEKESS